VTETLKLTGSAGPIMSEQSSLFGQQDVVGWHKGDLQIEVLERDLANDIIRANHYSGKIYNATYIHLGAFYRDELVGVAQYGYAMNPTSQESVVPGTGPKEYLELNRLWMDDAMPKNSESAFLSLTMKYIKATTPVRWVQSFADERCKLFGAVYQACSFLYCGEHTAVFWEVDGRTFHNSMTNPIAGKGPQGDYLRANIDRATKHNLRQFRYIKFLRPKYRRDLILPVLPYPKPAVGLEEKNPADQPGSAGAMPTHRSDVLDLGEAA
jgi:adenine modification enzyme